MHTPLPATKPHTPLYMRDAIISKASSTIMALGGVVLVFIFIAFMKHPEVQSRQNISGSATDAGTLPGKTYLALGDSYTIGEGVAKADNYPNQAVSLLRQRGHEVSDPLIIAETGWTTGDLTDAIKAAPLKKKYDFVTLLIGVNNQYQRLETSVFTRDFESLLKKAIRLAGNDTSHVFVISIPDWSVTPFATTSLPDRFERDKTQVSKEIGEYNAACQLISDKHHVSFIEITTSTLRAADDPSLVTSDGLHPSAKEYAVWAQKLADRMENKF